MLRFAIKHLPTGKFFYEDEGGSILVYEDEGFYNWGKKSDADQTFKYIKERTNNGNLILDDGEYSITDFDVVKL